MPNDVFFQSAGLSIAAHLYNPTTPNGRSIIVGHPGTSIKEQSPAIYARKLSDQGFRVLTFDAAHQGASEGLPRGLENPAQRVEDFKAAVSFLSAQLNVDSDKIGVLGICASGGYVIPAAAGDRRIRSVATVVAVDVGLQLRVGPDGKQDPAVINALLEGAASGRKAAAEGAEVGSFPVFPANEEQARAGGLHVFEGYDYYCTPRANHPRSAKSLTWDSVDRMATFDAFRFIDMISPRPLLMVTSEMAVTAWMTQQAFERANEPKRMYTVPGATHVEMYDREDAIDDAVTQLRIFFNETL